MLAATLPEHSNDGYVAAAYIVFLAIVLIYVAIMAVRLGRVQRKVEELRGDTDTGRLARARESASEEEPSTHTFQGANPGGRGPRAEGEGKEREKV
ncbi:MAG TPA: hypothetical protein VIG42_05465 [Solirubrobacteraceae bacterium]|jgi:hypothetical protein